MGDRRVTHLITRADRHHLGTDAPKPVYWCARAGNKGPQTEWLKQQKCLVSQFWRLEVQNQGGGRIGSF